MHTYIYSTDFAAAFTKDLAVGDR